MPSLCDQIRDKVIEPFISSYRDRQKEWDGLPFVVLLQDIWDIPNQVLSVYASGLQKLRYGVLKTKFGMSQNYLKEFKNGAPTYSFCLSL